jgi:microcystin-dependent protein
MAVLSMEDLLKEMNKRILALERKKTLDPTLAIGNNATAIGAIQARSVIVLTNVAGVRYIRLASIDGIGPSNGGQVLLSVYGGSNYGSLNRTSASVLFLQRGDNSVKVTVSEYGAKLQYYTKQISTYVFELWVRQDSYGSEMTVVLNEAYGGLFLVDSITSNLPAGLTPVTGFLDIQGQAYQNGGEHVLSMGQSNGPSLDVTNGDWNNVTSTGFYRGSNVANAPEGNTSYHYVVVNQNDPTYCEQIAGYYFGAANAASEHNLTGRMWRRVLTNGVWVDWRPIGGAPVGTIQIFASSGPPDGYLMCTGAAVSRATYPALFALIGTTYGNGDNSTTFNLPNMNGRIPVGRDSSQSEFATLGQVGGEKTHLLTTAEMPSHVHHQQFMNTSGGGPAGQASTAVISASNPAGSNVDTAATGGGGAHNNLQPYISISYIIKF